MTNAGGIELQEVSFTYANINSRSRPVSVFYKLNAQFLSNKISSILGKSGYGKSTILKLICGLLKPDDGIILINGARPYAIRSQKSLMYLPQEAFPAPWRTVTDNLSLVLEISGAKKNLHAYAQDFLSILGLSEFANYYPYNLSGGQKRRLSIGMALITRPSYVLLDEPFTGLDAITREELYCFILNIFRSQDFWIGMQRAPSGSLPTVLIVTHDLEEAALLGDNIYVIPSKLPVRAFHILNNPIKNINPGNLRTIKYEPGFRDLILSLKDKL